jgi:hypothetical protein
MGLDLQNRLNEMDSRRLKQARLRLRRIESRTSLSGSGAAIRTSFFEVLQPNSGPKIETLCLEEKKKVN